MFTRRDLTRLIWPLVVEQFLAATIGMADTLMVSSVGETAVSGVSLVDTINFLLIMIFSALATGGAIVSSQYLGREDSCNANKAAKQLLLVTASLSTVIMVVCLIFRTPILHGLFGSAEEAVLKNALTYFFWTTLSYPFIAIYNACAALFRSMGNSRISMFASILMNAANIIGNAVLIFGFGMGVAGAAIATLFSRVLGAVVMVLLLRNPRNILHLDSFRLGFHPAMIKNILRIGVPTGLENGMFQIGKILVQGLIASFGTVSITANAVANSICTFATIPGGAIGLALVTVVGQCVGAGDYQQAKRYTIRLTGLATGLVTGMNVLIALFSSVLISFFFVSPQTATLTQEIVFTHCIASSLIWSASFPMPNGLRAANDVRFTMTTAILSMWIFRIGFSYIIGQWLGLGVLGVWIAMYIDWLVRAIVFSIRLAGTRWQTKKLI